MRLNARARATVAVKRAPPSSLSHPRLFELGSSRALGSPADGHDDLGRSDRLPQPLTVSPWISDPRLRLNGPFGPLRTAHQSQPFVSKSAAPVEWADRTMNSARTIQAVCFQSARCFAFLVARGGVAVIAPRGAVLLVHVFLLRWISQNPGMHYLTTKNSD